MCVCPCGKSISFTGTAGSVHQTVTVPWRSTQHDLMSLSLEKKLRSLRVEGSLKPFHNEVREMLCAVCVWVKRLKTGLFHVWADYPDQSTGRIAGCNSLHVAEMTPQPNIKVVVMMMTTCDCLPPLSPPVVLIPVRMVTLTQKRVKPSCYTNWNSGLWTH